MTDGPGWTRKYADCGHEYDGATDTGYCRRCEADLRDQMECEAAERDAMREGDV